MRILIIDDSADARALLQTYLQAGGYQDLLTAESAVDAFRHRELSDPSAPSTLDFILKGELLARVRPALRLKAEMDTRKQHERELERRARELERALHEVKALQGCLPICTGCKKIRDDQGYWNQLEAYLSVHSGAEFTRSLCPDCTERLRGKAGPIPPRPGLGLGRKRASGFRRLVNLVRERWPRG